MYAPSRGQFAEHAHPADCSTYTQATRSSVVLIARAWWRFGVDLVQNRPVGIANKRTVGADVKCYHSMTLMFAELPVRGSIGVCCSAAWAACDHLKSAWAQAQ